MPGASLSDRPATALQRLDRWLWFARFFKSRTLAGKISNSRKVRINGQIANKAAATVKVDDILTFPLGRHMRVIKIWDLGQRRGPAPEARALCEDLAPPEDSGDAEWKTKGAAALSRSSGRRPAGAGRPTKRDRRAVDRLLDE
ncbi:MAG: RNA-binding S4 domain-containing protein [Alphaproteobacteria bacterium]|nr:RNA-binding S4 domain-containing protein [Alphaproteobacteria bacterium]